jgi:glycosyltransferase involved in cell wall biosynthesis
MERLPISAIIPTRNAEKTLGDCLASVQINNPSEVIVVDGMSSDRTIEIARKFTDNIYSDEGKGFNYAQQLGVEQASQEYIALIDSDIVLPEGTLATLLAELQVSGCVSMAAIVKPANISTYWERAIDWHLREFRNHRGTGGLQATVLRRDTLIKYRLDAIISVGSDHDFALRAKKEGLKAGTSSAYVYHHHPTGLKSLYKQRFRFGNDSVELIKAYGPGHIEFWPPLNRTYWLFLCLVKFKPIYIPYVIVDWIAETTGMIKGFLKLLGKALRRRPNNAV